MCSFKDMLLREQTDYLKVYVQVKHEYLLMKLQLIQKYTVKIKNSPSDPHLYSQSVGTFLEGRWVTSMNV